MTLDNDRDDTLELNADGEADDAQAWADEDTGDTTMAAGPRSGAAGVANAELGTSGSPAETLLSPEELAQVESDGGSGLQTGRVDAETLHDSFAEHDQKSGY